jgi:hypothetical protein
MLINTKYAYLKTGQKYFCPITRGTVSAFGRGVEKKHENP